MKERGLYENISFARDCIENYKNTMNNNDDNAEFIDAMMDVIDYADGCYVNHCEEVGQIAIENIEEHAEDIIKDRFPSQKDVDTYVGRPGFGTDLMTSNYYRAGFLEAYRWIKSKLFSSNEEVQK